MEKSEQREQRPTAAHIESAYHKEEEVKVTPSLPEHRQFKPKKKMKEKEWLSCLSVRNCIVENPNQVPSDYLHPQPTERWFSPNKGGSGGVVERQRQR